MSSDNPPKGGTTPEAADGAAPSEPLAQVSYEQTVDDPYGYGYDPYARDDSPVSGSPNVPAKTELAAPPAAPPPPPAASPADEDDGDEDGMLRMSFLEHLEELRSRLIKILAGLGIAFLVSLIFAQDLWKLVSAPAADALKSLGFEPVLAQLTPMDGFTTIWVKLPLLAAIFLASPWVLYQVWAFIAPGLYKRERKWAAPFVIISAGLFILGGLFAYFVAFRFGLTFLLGVGKDVNVKPVVSIVEYFDLFVNVTLGIGLVFELPILIFFLTLLRIVTPGFLIRNSRYAILIIVIVAAVITPTPDVINLTIFATPMVLLYFVGVFAGWLLVLSREGKAGGVVRSIWIALAALAVFAALVVGLAVFRFGYHFSSQWPFLVR
jgi:sec-independent protein translocase protein TatC